MTDNIAVGEMNKRQVWPLLDNVLRSCRRNDLSAGYGKLKLIDCSKHVEVAKLFFVGEAGNGVSVATCQLKDAWHLAQAAFRLPLILEIWYFAGWTPVGMEVWETALHFRGDEIGEHKRSDLLPINHLIFA
jgi:hypothetical protein